MKKTKILWAILLIVAMALATFLGCQKDGGEDQKDNGPTSRENEAGIGENDGTGDSPQEVLPVVDYKGKDFKFFMCDEFFVHRDILAEEGAGDVLEDAKYKRFKTVEGKYNINLETVCLGAAGETYDYLNKSMMTGDVEYDLTYIHDNSLAQTVAAGLLCDMKTLQYPNFSNPWWNESAISSWEIKGSQFVCPSVVGLPYSQAIVFNKDMVRDYAMESPYELVRSGEWTMDKLFEMCSNISQDIDGNGIWDKEDQYGFSASWDWECPAYLSPGNYLILTKDEDGSVKLNDDYAHLTQIAEKFVRLFTENNVAFAFRSAEIAPDYPIPMSSGRIFALSMHLGHISMLRSSDVEYGIVPLPKFDKNQEKYTGYDWGHLFAIPANAPDPEMSGLIFDALTGESYNSILPVFKEQQLGLKFTRDEESIEMLGIIYDNILYDMGTRYQTLAPYYLILSELYYYNNTNVMSYMEKIESQMQAALETIIDFYDK